MSFCEPHFRRTGQKIPAVRVVADTPMCLACFRGRHIDPIEEYFGLPLLVADALNSGRRPALANERAIRRVEAA
jgi:hypothetical protein